MTRFVMRATGQSETHREAGGSDALASAASILTNEKALGIFPEGTRSKDGRPKKFYTRGLITLFEHIPDATVVALSINNSWKLAKYRYFPIPLGVKVNLKVQATFKLSEHEPNKLLKKLEEQVTLGVVSI